MNKRPEQGRLLRMTVETATRRQKKLIKEAKQRVAEDPWYRTGGFHPDVNASLIGYTIYGGRAVPVYQTDHGYFAVEHDWKNSSASSSGVNEGNIYFLS